MPAFIIDPFVFFLVVFVLCTQKADADIFHMGKLRTNVLRVDFIGNGFLGNFYDFQGLKFLSKLGTGLKRCKPYLKTDKPHAIGPKEKRFLVWYQIFGKYF